MMRDGKMMLPLLLCRTILVLASFHPVWMHLRSVFRFGKKAKKRGPSLSASKGPLKDASLY